ncbi:hypothetical protein [Polymorphobacter sp.]|uniref:hypothetical protein n=1 Tax=Polymorphobacter sp. TaxID=1909290 RepID=UPI003F724FF3
MDISNVAAVERVARVLAGQRLSINAEGLLSSASEEVDAAWEEHVDDAIAVLKTLRAPDPEMAAVGDVAVWQRMIAAALAQPHE